MPLQVRCCRRPFNELYRLFLFFSTVHDSQSACLFQLCITVSRNTASTRPSFLVVNKMAQDDDGTPSLPNFAERGVSIDQDGKSNVWAIEPKMEVTQKSSEEKTSSLLLGGGILGVLSVVAAGILTNLPDPNQF